MYTYGRFPRPASTKHAQVDTICVRIENNIPYQSKTHRGFMNKNIPHTTPRKQCVSYNVLKHRGARPWKDQVTLGDWPLVRSLA